MKSIAWVSIVVAIAFVRSAKSQDYDIATYAGSGKSELAQVVGDARKVAIAQPFGVEIGPRGNLFVCEVGNHRILQIDRKTQKAKCVAGNGRAGYSGDGGPAISAQLNEPYEIRFDKDGHLFVVEMVGAVVRRIDAKTGIISTVAGTGARGFSGDGGPATKARLNRPHSIALDGRGGLYIADIGNHRIRRVDLKSGVIETIAGTGEKSGPMDGSRATGNAMLGPRALFVADDTLWIALREGHSVWSMDLLSRKLTHIAGRGSKGFADGVGKEALFNRPKGIAVGPKGQVFVVDTENQAIRRIDPSTRRVSTIAGFGAKGAGFIDDAPRDARHAKMGRPHGVCVSEAGLVFIGDTNNHRVRVLSPRRSSGR